MRTSALFGAAALAGEGSYVVDASGAAALTGTVTGRPFDGAFTAGLAAEDGSLPEAGFCEPGAAAVRVAGPGRRVLEVVAAGQVCGEWPTPTYLATHVFTGSYDVTTSSVRRLAGTDGWVSLRLANDGRAGIALVDS